MKVKDVKKGDWLKLGTKIFRVEAVTPTGEVIIEVDQIRDWDGPRPEGVNEYQRRYGYAYFPMTTLCARLKQGELCTVASADLAENFLVPVIMTYKIPKGWTKQAVGNETVNLWAYPEAKDMCTYNSGDCYVDEYGIRRSGTDRAITPNHKEWLRIMGHVKPELDIIRDTSNPYKFRTQYIVLTTPIAISEGLNGFLEER